MAVDRKSLGGGGKLFARKRRLDLAVEILLLLLSLAILVPLLIMLLGAFKSPEEAQRFDLALPKEWRFENFRHVIETGNLGRAFVNSLIVSVCSVLICILTATMAGFTIARRGDRTARFFRQYFMVGLIAPAQMVTTFALLKVLGLLGSHAGVILVLAASQIPWALFMIVNFVKSIPRELDQAAFIDGCGPLRMFGKVVLPLMKPIFATTTVMVAMTSWNEFMMPLYFLDSSSKWTMPLTVYNFFGQYFRDWQYVFADLVLTALPITLLYLYAQKYIVSGLLSGAVKG